MCFWLWNLFLSGRVSTSSLPSAICPITIRKCFRKYKVIKILAVMKSGFSMKNDRDYLHPIEKKLGLLVRWTGCCIYEYLCLTTEVQLAEISFYVCGAPVIIHGSIFYADLDSLVTTAHLYTFLALINFLWSLKPQSTLESLLTGELHG